MLLLPFIPIVALVVQNIYSMSAVIIYQKGMLEVKHAVRPETSFAPSLLKRPSLAGLVRLPDGLPFLALSLEVTAHKFYRIADDHYLFSRATLLNCHTSAVALKWILYTAAVALTHPADLCN